MRNIAPEVTVAWDESKQLAGAFGASEAVLELAILKVRECRGEEGLGDERVLRGMRVGFGEVIQSADGHAHVLFEDAAEASKQADA